MMVTYRITKFDPAKRDKAGAYTDHAEWTSISDIGKSKYGSPTYEEYEKVEMAYVAAITIVLAVNNIQSLSIDSLGLYTSRADFESFKTSERLRNLAVAFDRDMAGLKEGQAVPVTQIDQLIRLRLREIIWMDLIAPQVKVEFGYDYYMYVTCGELPAAAIKQIEETGLFVE
ncbi:hypothetical protein LGH70_08625 [Hymenobacter sp. BT635]|uniref:Uncharacterized protein n=1 Tax=Hymenobacter nitidus TaxID=2880929 RepID=A0ABS8AE05_9BACT|nr:hypothetical protein [Hymenobacter nitidus]MCB2377644.1 hypothetical protein [Hymenobacter nitidus]